MYHHLDKLFGTNDLKFFNPLNMYVFNKLPYALPNVEYEQTLKWPPFCMCPPPLVNDSFSTVEVEIFTHSIFIS